jgi:hypothetical protein
MNFENFQTRFKTHQDRLTSMADRFPWENQDAYLSWLAQTYEYVRYSTRILALTGGRFPVSKTAFATRFFQHAAEERGHDRLLVNDAKAFAKDIAELPVFPEAEAFHKSLYFWIYQGDPTVMFGWIFCLEGFAVLNGPRIYERVLAAHGKRGASFLHVHSAEDPDHLEKAFQTVRSLPESDLIKIVQGLDLYCKLYENIFSAIESETRRHSRAA